MFVRGYSMLVFGWMAYDYFEKNKQKLAIIMGCLCILFQPIFIIPMDRSIWLIVDAIVAVLMLVLWWVLKIRFLSHEQY